MIYNELPTAFPFYDKIEKQQRFRENAEMYCDYRLINPKNSLLPFQIKIDYNRAAEIFDRAEVFQEGERVDANGSIIEDENYIRTGYIEINSSTINYRTREVISVLGWFFDEDYSPINVIQTATKEGSVVPPANAKYAAFNVSKNKATRVRDKFEFTLSKDDLLPLYAGEITEWKIFDEAGREAIDLSKNIELIRRDDFLNGQYCSYNGEVLKVETYSNPEAKLHLPVGKYYSYIKLERGDKFYSEVFTVPGDWFYKGEESNFMKIEFWNSCDIEPISYGDGWRQETYIDSFIFTSEPEVEEDGARDGDDNLIPTFQKMVVKYRFSAAVPDFMKIALVSLQIHDNVRITTAGNIREGKVERISSSATTGESGAYSVVDIVLEQHILTKKACCSNMEKL